MWPTKPTDVVVVVSLGGIGGGAAVALEDREMRSKIYIFAATKARSNRVCTQYAFLQVQWSRGIIVMS